MPGKIKTTIQCSRCSTLLIKNQGKKLCSDCKNTKNIQKLTLQEAKERYSNIHNRHSCIVQYSRKIYNASNKPKFCIICQYKIHYDVCHIKAINLFEESTLISEINNIDNLIAVCPNHHWEYNHKMMSELDLQKLNKICALAITKRP